MAKNVLLVAGLPGCGKTTYLSEMKRDGWVVFDDFKACAIDDSPRFQNSRHFPALIARLREGVRCVVADIDFCNATSRAEAEHILGTEISGLEIGWLYFSHDEQTCEANIKYRDRESIVEDLRALRRYSAGYSIPKGAEVRAVASGSMVQSSVKGAADVQL